MRRQAARSNTALTAGLLLTLLAVCLLLMAGPAHAATFTVNSTGDAGDNNPGNGSCDTGVRIPGGGVELVPECTLRAAIQETNANDNDATVVDSINFGIPGSGVKTIQPTSGLPSIAERAIIDGYPQPGSEPNTLASGTNAAPKIELDGTNVGSVSGLGLAADGSVIRGLVINRFVAYGVGISTGNTENKIEGNFSGTNPDGASAQGNGTGVLLQNADGSTLGGTTPGARNLISGNSYRGVALSAGSSGNKIQGNLIGTDKNGTADLGNDDYGVIVSSSSNSAPINNNTIGDSDPTDGLTNAANTIAFNTDGGVQMYPVSTGNRILSNSMFSNGGLGIDLVGGTEDADGVSANDPKDPDTGSNRLQNFPVLSFAQEGFDNTTSIGGSLNSTPSTRKKTKTFTIQFFSNPSTDPNEGKTFLGQRQVKTDRQGNASVGFSTSAATEGEYITATATNKATWDTSEFSQARVVEGSVIGGG